MSFIYEQFPGQEETRKLILDDVLRWRARILDKLTQAAERRPPAMAVDLESLADHTFTILEGGFVLARADGRPAEAPRPAPPPPDLPDAARPGAGLNASTPRAPRSRSYAAVA